MKASARAVEPHYSSELANLPVARTYAPHEGSSVADLHRLLADHFPDGGAANDREEEQAGVERLTHGVSRAAGVASLVAGYALTGYLISLLIF